MKEQLAAQTKAVYRAAAALQLYTAGQLEAGRAPGAARMAVLLAQLQAAEADLQAALQSEEPPMAPTPPGQVCGQTTFWPAGKQAPPRKHAR
mgnify:FL=1